MLASAEFWVAVAFAIFVIGIFKPARKAILGALDERTAKIKAEIDEAARLREEAQAALAAYQRKQREAVKEAEDILARAREDAERLSVRSEENLEAALKRREREALDLIAQAEAEALQEVCDKTVDIAVSATRRLLEEYLDDKRSKELVDDAISEIPRKLH